MFKYKYAVYRQLNIGVDALIVALSFFIALVIRGCAGTDSFSLPWYSSVYFPDYCWVLVFPLVLLWPLFLNANRLYPTDRLRTWSRASKIILKSSIQALFLIYALLFIFKFQDMSRTVILMFAVIVSFLLILKEGLVVGYLHTLRRSGANLRNVLVVGTIESSCEIIRTIEENKHLGLNVAGLLVPANEVVKKEACNYRILGELKDAEEIINNSPIDHVIITIGASECSETEDVLATCEEEGVEVWLVASIFNIKMAKLDSDELFGIPMFVFRTVPQFSWQFFTKNIFDKIGALICGVISLPLIALSAVLVKLTSKGPVFFKQKRCGVQGREFTLYKIRTMCISADEKLNELREKNVLKGPVFKMANDPRVTPVGRFLRKTSIDELPQLWNVFKGDMSLVGPRPAVRHEVDKYEKWQRRRLSMKPGITGLWQVSGRSIITDFNKWVEFDLRYIDNWSLFLDIKILLKTIVAVVTGYGAY
ncbi:sugar transferase [Candidatus Omnitrophota bacterium]